MSWFVPPLVAPALLAALLLAWIAYQAYAEGDVCESLGVALGSVDVSKNYQPSIFLMPSFPFIRFETDWQIRSYAAVITETVSRSGQDELNAT